MEGAAGRSDPQIILECGLSSDVPEGLHSKLQAILEHECPEVYEGTGLTDTEEDNSDEETEGEENEPYK